MSVCRALERDYVLHDDTIFLYIQALLGSILNVKAQQVTLSQVRVSERSKTSCVVVLHSSKVCLVDKVVFGT